MPLFRHPALGGMQDAQELQRIKQCKRKLCAMDIEDLDHPTEKREKIDYQTQQLFWGGSGRPRQIDAHVQDNERQSLHVEESMDFHGHQLPTCSIPPAYIVNRESQEPRTLPVLVTESEMAGLDSDSLDCDSIDCDSVDFDSGMESGGLFEFNVVEDGGEFCSTCCRERVLSPVSKTMKCSCESSSDELYDGYYPLHYLSDYY